MAVHDNFDEQAYEDDLAAQNAVDDAKYDAMFPPQEEAPDDYYDSVERGDLSEDCDGCGRVLDDCTCEPEGAPEGLAEFFDAVQAERSAQLAKWGDQRHPDGTNLDNAGWREHARSLCQKAAAEGRVTWAHILQEEFVEALAETDPVKIRAELVQVAAVCAAWISDIDRRDPDA